MDKTLDHNSGMMGMSIAGPSIDPIAKGPVDIRFLDCLNTDFTHLRRFSIAAKLMIRVLRSEDARNSEEFQLKLVENIEAAKETLSEAGASALPFVPCPAQLTEYRQAYYDMLHAAQPLVPHIQDLTIQLRLRRLLLPLSSTSHFRIALVNKTNHSYKKSSSISSWWESHKKSMRGKHGIKTTSKTSVLGTNARQPLRRQNTIANVRRSSKKPASQCWAEAEARQKRQFGDKVPSITLSAADKPASESICSEDRMSEDTSTHDDNELSSDEEEIHSDEDFYKAFCAANNVEEAPNVIDAKTTGESSTDTGSSKTAEATPDGSYDKAEEASTNESQTSEDSCNPLAYDWAEAGEEPHLPEGFTWAKSWPDASTCSDGSASSSPSVFAPDGLLGPNFFEEVRQAQLRHQMAGKPGADSCSIM